MKIKLLFFMSLLFASSSLIISCSEDFDEVLDLKLSKKNISLKVEESQTFEILKGNGSYNVKSSDKSIVSVAIEQNIVTLKALKIGKVKIIVTDGKDQKKEVSIDVIHSDIIIDNDKIILKTDQESQIFILSGSGDYKIESDDKVKVVLIKNKINIKGLKEGKSTIKVIDNITKKFVEIQVTISETIPSFTVDKKEVELFTQEEIEVQIISGSGDYSFEFTKNNVVSSFLTRSTGKIKIIGKSKDVVEMKIIDNISKETITVKITVKAFVYPIFKIKNKTIEFIEGQKGELLIEQGTPPYKISALGNTNTTHEIKNNKVVFSGSVTTEDRYTIEDKSARVFSFQVKVYEKLSIEVNKLELLKGEVRRFKVNGLVSAIKFTNNSTNVSVEKDAQSNYYKITAKERGTANISFTDGVHTETLKINISEPSTLKIGKGGFYNEIDYNIEYDYELGKESLKFYIIGGSGQYDVSFGNSKLLKVHRSIKKEAYEDNTYVLRLSRVKSVRESGVIKVKVARKEAPSDFKIFKIKCAALISANLKLNGNVLEKLEKEDTTKTTPYYYIDSVGWSDGLFKIKNVKVDDIINFDIINAASPFNVAPGIGSQYGELIGNTPFNTFQVKAKGTGTYYLSVMDRDNSDETLEVVIDIK